MDKSDEVLLIDQWDNQEALDRHHQSEMIQVITDLRNNYILTMKVERFVDDKDGIPERDKKYIIEEKE